MKLKYLLLFILGLIFYSVTAQNKTIVKKADSLSSSFLNEYKSKMAKFEEQRISDSIKKSELERQLYSLKTNDVLKKEQLEKQLRELSEEASIKRARKKQHIDSIRNKVKGFPVMGFFDDTLFVIYNKLGSFSAQDRAEAITKRIEKLSGIFKYYPDSLKVIPEESEIDIVYGEKLITSITEEDALWNDTSKEILADNYKNYINNAIVKYKEETNLFSLAKKIGLVILVLFVLSVLIYFIRKLFGKIADRIKAQEGKLIRDFKINNYTLFDKSRSVNIVLSINTILMWAIKVLAMYISLPLIFSIFPWTKNIAETLIGYILTPLKDILHAVWNYLPNLFTILVILFIFRYVYKIVHFLKNEIENGNLHIDGFYQDWANPTYQIIRVLLFAFMVIVIFPYLPGSDSPIFQGVSVFLGFLFTFGSAGSLSNVISGLVLTYMRLFKIGDRVKINDITGDVIEKSLLVTRIRTIKNEIISIPNSSVMNGHTINYSSDAPTNGLIVHTTVTIGYDIPWREMHQALIEAAYKTEFIVPEPKPFVLQTSLDDFYVSYQINAYTKDPNKQAIIYSNLHQNIQDICNERGIEILSPHYRAARDGNKTTIPNEYLKEDYKTPMFNINVNKDDKI